MNREDNPQQEGQRNHENRFHEQAPWQRNPNPNPNQQANNPIEQWYRDIPPITKIYTIGTAITALALQFGYTTPYQLYYHPDLILYKGQLWRLFSTFLYFGPFGIDFLFHTFFMMRYFRSLEEGWYRDKKADFCFLITFGMILFLILGPIFGMVFLGTPLVFMMVYIWGRRNPYLMMSFLGLFTFTAPYLPWVLLGFSLIISKSFPVGDFIGIIVGHLYYFLNDVLPRTHALRPLDTPIFFKRLFREHEQVADVVVQMNNIQNIHAAVIVDDDDDDDGDSSGGDDDAEIVHIDAQADLLDVNEHA